MVAPCLPSMAVARAITVTDPMFISRYRARNGTPDEFSRESIRGRGFNWFQFVTFCDP
jgi:hypothetical protein